MRVMLQELVGRVGSASTRVFAGMEEHLAVPAVLHGAAQGKVWVDDAFAPRTGVVWTAHRVFVAGSDAEGLNRVVQEIAAAARLRGDWGIGVYGAGGTDWGAVLEGLTWRDMVREYWQSDRAADPTPQRERIAARMAEHANLRLRPVDAALLAEPELGALAQLREEMCSERESVADFLARSFGVCLVDVEQHALAGWCLSEYNHETRCEVGIEVLEGYQRRGLGTLLTQALCVEAAQRGIDQVGWHCLAANEPSRATARRAGLQLVKQYRAPLVLLGEQA